MRASYRWLQSFFDEQATLPEPRKLAELLTMNAFEVEGIEETQDDAVFDIAILPNRGHDCLSHVGIAKEVAALCGIPLMRDPLEERPTLSPDSNILSVTVADTARCPRYSAAVIRGVSVGESPVWLKERLLSIGVRSINNIVDATNYVMFELGQPLHAFDMGSLVQSDGLYTIEVRPAKRGETILALDGNTHSLLPEDLVIADANRGFPIGIAGVKGGKRVEISEKTNDIVIESAHFNATAIRKTAARLKLRTDASMRFEHELSPELTVYGLAEIIQIIIKCAGGVAEGFVDVYPSPQKETRIVVHVSEVNKLLGTNLAVSEVEAIFNRLSFPFEREGDRFIVTAPFLRLDLRTSEDLIEEVGRLYGYEKIIAHALLPAQSPSVNKLFYYEEKIRQTLIAEGFSEVLTSSFVEASEGEVATANPLAADRPALRKHLRTGIFRSLTLNAHMSALLGLADIRLFEIGTVFTSNNEYIALGIGIKPLKNFSVAALPVVVQKLSEALGGAFEPEIMTEEFCQINLTAHLSKLRAPSAYDAPPIIPETTYRPFSSYPFVLRDIALFVPEEMASGEVEKYIREEAGELLLRATLFDEYKKNGKISYAFRLVFQSMERTLVDEEVNERMKKIEAALGARGFEVR